MAKQLPKEFQWLLKLEIPLELKLALSHYGTLEKVGKGSNPDISSWAKEVGVSGWYPDDDIPWCGLFKGINARRAGWLTTPKYDLLSALSWLAWGEVIDKCDAMIGDTLIFGRKGGGHVGYYIGEDETHYCVYGGNQSNACGFTWIEKTRLMGVRRAKWKNSQPKGVKKMYLSRNGAPISQNEA